MLFIPGASPKAPPGSKLLYIDLRNRTTEGFKPLQVRAGAPAAAWRVAGAAERGGGPAGGGAGGEGIGEDELPHGPGLGVGGPTTSLRGERDGRVD